MTVKLATASDYLRCVSSSMRIGITSGTAHADTYTALQGTACWSGAKRQGEAGNYWGTGSYLTRILRHFVQGGRTDLERPVNWDREITNLDSGYYWGSELMVDSTHEQIALCV